MKAHLILFLAAIFEIGWPLGFRLASCMPQHKTLFLVLSALSMGLSGYLLYLAQKTISVSTAYIIWTGAGAVGTFLIGLIWFGDTATALKITSALMVVAGIAGLEML